MYFTTPDILIVEDEEFNRDIMARRLESGNYSLRFAVDGQQALDMVAEKKPDLILLDIMLPEIMGLQVLHTLRQQHSMVDLPIIMVTAVEEEQRIVRSFELGANDFVSKPVNFPILIARLQTQLSLKQLSAMNAEFVTTASQDLSKPIAVIQDIAASSRALLLSHHPLHSEDMLQRFQAISQSADYISTITEYILNTQAGGFEQIRLTKIPLHIGPLILETIYRHHAYASEKRINLINKSDDNMPTVEADRSRIAQVLNNLIDNAVKFCSANDTITVTTKVDNDEISVIVSDTGPGLTDSDFEQLFVKNAKLSNQPSNSEISKGPGLATCKQLIELHGGEIGAMNNHEHGVSFWFKLPVSKLKPV